MKILIKITKFKMSFNESRNCANKILKEVQLLTNLKILRIRTALKLVSSILLSFVIIKPIIKSMTEIQTMNPSIKLKLSAQYFLSPNPKSLIIISIKKKQVSIQLIIEQIFYSYLSSGNLYRQRITKFIIIAVVQNKEKTQ